MAERLEITLTVNGEQVTREVPVRLTLADFLRHELELTGTHLGCEHGVCGACTILLDGKTARSCLLLAVQTDGMSVDTVEGMADNGALTPLQQAFIDNHGLQCGFCTPGMITRAHRLLQENPNPTEEEVRFGMSGNICRCTGYQNIVKSILSAAAEMNAAKEAAQ